MIINLISRNRSCQDVRDFLYRTKTRHFLRRQELEDIMRALKLDQKQPFIILEKKVSNFVGGGPDLLARSGWPFDV